ncbi:DnaD domain protein [Streptococcus sanguinis]|nr:DnaD domain protein [Streptococcus sanguinis]MBZ2049187.1 DnaD domain protein [Streptococcus sanguinis]MBZ2051311.1 DnaD domain protein [Streptococcus sanguinis]MBZ2060784.1 DnaD domain protein [Streptococcus sanguinis]
MKLLRRLPGGEEHTIIYLKLMLASLQDNGNIYFEGLADSLAEEMALIIDEDAEAVRMTLMFLEQKKLLTTSDNFAYKLEQVPEMIGSETASTRRSRKHRSTQKALQCNTDATKCNGEIEKDINIDLDKDINIELEVRVEKEDETLTTAEISKLYQSRIGVLDGQQYQMLIDYITEDKMEPDLIKRAIGKAADNSKRSFGYINRILKNWAQNGIRTVAQQDEEQRRYLEKKGIYKPDSNIPEWSKEHPNYQPPEESTILSREEFLAQDD